MLKQEIARLTAALERGDGGSESEVGKLRKANRVLEAHVDMLRSNLSAARTESAEQIAQLESGALKVSCTALAPAAAIEYHHVVKAIREQCHSQFTMGVDQHCHALAACLLVSTIWSLDASRLCNCTLSM